MDTAPPTHIHQIKMQCFRGARNLTLELNARLNVFVGMNGAGKSSVLDASAILLSWLVNRVKHSTAAGRPISESDIRNAEPSSNLEMILCDDGDFVSWSLAKARRGHRRRDVRSVLSGVTTAAQKIQSINMERKGRFNLPVFAYYPVNRTALNISLRTQAKQRLDLLSANENSLTGGVNFRDFFEWFRMREDLENESRRYLNQKIKPDGFQFPDRQLEVVRRAISQLVPVTVRRNPLRLEVGRNDQLLTVNQLSNGEKCLMAMVGDMARRMTIANPLRNNPLEGEGVFLIDEIELHLHPKLQRMVIQQLPKVFPNCQFLISTHSPHVITHVQPESLFLLSVSSDGLEAAQPTASYGKTVEGVLEDLMGLETTRPVKIDKALQRVFADISAGRLIEARELIEVLQTQIGSDPDLVKAGVLIKRKEQIGI